MFFLQFILNFANSTDVNPKHCWKENSKLFWLRN